MGRAINAGAEWMRRQLRGLRALRPLTKAEQLSLFGGKPEKPRDRQVKNPGVRGGKYWVDDAGHIRYDERPKGQASAAPAAQPAPKQAGSGGGSSAGGGGEYGPFDPPPGSGYRRPDWYRISPAGRREIWDEYERGMADKAGAPKQAGGGGSGDGGKFKAGDKVAIPFKGKMTNGTVVRYDVTDGDYIVDVGEYRSERVPAHAVKPPREGGDGKFKVKLSHGPNTDLMDKETPGYWEHPGGDGKPQEIEVGSIEEAQRAAVKYRDKHALGGGNWSGGEVTNAAGKVVGKISYNGRFWPEGGGDPVEAPERDKPRRVSRAGVRGDQGPANLTVANPDGFTGGTLTFKVYIPGDKRSGIDRWQYRGKAADLPAHVAQMFNGPFPKGSTIHIIGGSHDEGAGESGGGGASKIKAGDKVRIKPEFQDAGDDEFEWTALEDEDGGRVRISPRMPDMTIQPQTIVQAHMLEPAPKSTDEALGTGRSAVIPPNATPDQQKDFIRRMHVGDKPKGAVKRGDFAVMVDYGQGRSKMSPHQFKSAVDAAAYATRQDGPGQKGTVVHARGPNAGEPVKPGDIKSTAKRLYDEYAAHGGYKNSMQRASFLRRLHAAAKELGPEGDPKEMMHLDVIATRMGIDLPELKPKRKY